MPVRELRASPVLALERFANFEAFRPSDVIGGGTSIPLHLTDFSASRAALALPASRLVMQRSFARRFEADMGAPSAALIVPLSSDAYAELNGRPVSGSSVVFFRGVVATRSLEPRANKYAMLRFHSAMQNRGWKEFQGGFEVLPTPPIQRLQSVLINIAAFASSCADVRQFASAADAIENSLLEALDEVLLDDRAIRPIPRTFARHQKLVALLDELVRETSSIPLYSEGLAHRVGVSVRTLQTAVQARCGMSLHQYLRLKRLWSTRCRLMAGLPGVTVRAAALANGFWHMGEFSSMYKVTFGETPSETLARAKSF